MDNKTYTAKLVLTSSAPPQQGMLFNFEWDPPLSQTLAEYGEGNMPYSYDYMAHLLETKFLPDMVLNDRYVAMLKEDGDKQLEFDFKETPVENPTSENLQQV